jgi:S1-C subfamily serine protease
MVSQYTRQAVLSLASLLTLSGALAVFCIASVPFTAFAESPSENQASRSWKLSVEESASFDERIISALRALPKTLIVEESRGSTDVLVYKKAAPATVLVLADRGPGSQNVALGSGVVVSAAADVLTNYHVIADATRIVVIFKPEKGVKIEKDLAYAAIPTKVDAASDLALLRVVSPPSRLTYLSFGDTAKLEVRDDVHAIGHPDGQVWTYTTGTISQIRPKFRWKDNESGRMHEANVIQTQTAINPGNSGGPLLDDHAEIIGINSFQMKGEQGLNYAIAANSIQDFLKQPVNQPATSVASQPGEKPLRVEHFGKHVLGEYAKS